MRRKEIGMQEHGLDLLNWPVVVCSLSVLPFLDELWRHLPSLTAVYTTVTVLFMLFQMADKLGLLDRFKRRPRIDID